MGYELQGEDVVFVQRLLSSEGFYTGELNGNWTANTEQAMNLFYSKSAEIREHYGSFDERTESEIATLKLLAQLEARKFMNRVLKKGLRVKITSGTRSYAEQDEIWQKGRNGNKGKIRTKLKGGESAHNFGVAWDISVFTKRGQLSRNEKLYDKAARYGKSKNIIWGGDWKSFVDRPHYQLKTGSVTKKQAREIFERGEQYLVWNGDFI